jgi:hypothetical protein
VKENIQYLHGKKLPLKSVDMKKKKWVVWYLQGKHTEKDSGGGCLVLLKKLMRKRQTKNNQVCLTYGVYNQSNGFKRFPTVRDLSRSPTLEGAQIINTMFYS